MILGFILGLAAGVVLITWFQLNEEQKEFEAELNEIFDEMEEETNETFTYDCMTDTYNDSCEKVSEHIPKIN